MSTHTLSLSCHCPVMFNVQWSMFNEETSGGYCSGVPPLPIPNREVKPACADGTAMQCGRVGSRRLFLKKSPKLEITWGFFVFPPPYSPPPGRSAPLPYSPPPRGRLPLSIPLLLGGGARGGGEKLFYLFKRG